MLSWTKEEVVHNCEGVDWLLHTGPAHHLSRQTKF